jgi:signal transduction histidine kinase/AraC-like DNA-binding protein
MNHAAAVQDELAEFRAEALTVMLALLSLGWMMALVADLIYTRAVAAPWRPAPLAVMLVALIAANRLRHRRWVLAGGGTMVIGLLAANGVAFWQHGFGPATAALLVIPVLAASLLLGRAVELAVALVASVLALLAAAADHHGSMVLRGLLALGDIWPYLAAYWAAATISHLHARHVHTLIGWSLDSQQKDARRAELFYQQSEQLKQTLLALEHAHARLQIANAELAEARQIADAANRHKTQFLANVSHELRTPLGIIIGSSETWLCDRALGRLPPGLQRDLHHIHQSGVHLQRLINDLLDCSRLEIGALEIFPETIDTRAFVHEVFHSLADHTMAGSPVAWRLRLPERLPCLNADPVRLRQILLNLLQNAAQHTHQGSITLGVEVCPPHLHFWVEDTGCGIPFDMQQRIFEPFVTAGDPAQRRSGIGLGLSISRQLVQLHHGLLTLESQPGHGTTVHLYLPLPSLSGPVATPVASDNPTLLLIARGAPPREVIDLSQRQCLPLRRVRPGDDLAALLQEVRPVGIVWNMAGEFDDDWPLIAQIRQHPYLCQLPLILYSQAGRMPDLSQGITDVRLKPISSAAFVQSTQALRRHPGPILVVDDDPQARECYCRLLYETAAADEVVTAAGGREALEWLAQATPSLVILDLMMPEVDGFAVLEHLRANPATRRTPVLVLSGRMLSFEDVERLNAGNVTFQAKDIWQDTELAAHLGRMLEGAERSAPSASALVKRGLAFIQQHYAQIAARHEIAAAIGVSERYLSQLFMAELGISPWEYLLRYRVRQARHLLRTSDLPIALIASEVGFDDPAYFSRLFRKEVGCTPRDYRLGAAAAPLSA